MIKDFLISFKDNFKNKTRNPFLGTYLVVWLIRNWELVYTIFNFDKNYKLADKINFIKNYYSEISFIENLFTNILWAFGLLILTYLLLNISRLIINLSEKQLSPWIYKITDSKSIVLKEVYEILKNENNNLESKLEKERESKSRLQNEVSKLEEKIDSLISTNQNKENEIEKSKPLQIDLENEVNVLYNKIKKNGYVDEYFDVISNIGKTEPGWIKNEYMSEAAYYFIKLGLLNSGKEETNWTELNLTELGEKVLRRSRLEID